MDISIEPETYFYDPHPALSLKNRERVKFIESPQK
jgi:hypothetical protein